MTTAADWFADEFEFRQMCSDARSLARGERAEEFAHEMVQRAVAEGLKTPLTQLQLNWLAKIAEWEVPPRRTAK